MGVYTNVLKYYERGGILQFGTPTRDRHGLWGGVYTTVALFPSLNDDEDGYGNGRIIVLTYCTFSGSNTSDLRFSDGRDRWI
jgi:hypothetical protein